MKGQNEKPFTNGKDFNFSEIIKFRFYSLLIIVVKLNVKLLKCAKQMTHSQQTIQ